MGRTPAPVVVAAGTPMAAGPGGHPRGHRRTGGVAGPSGGVDRGGRGPVGVVVVHVRGPVRRPGVLRLPAGSRVVDAVAAAGGLLAGADPGPVNLARVLVDGEQVRLGPGAPVDGGATASGGGGSPVAATGLVDLNAAGLADLDALPGVGPVLAQRILDLRAERGRFTSVEELREVARHRREDVRGHQGPGAGVTLPGDRRVRV